MKITPEFFAGIRELIVGARSSVARGADLVQVYTNFEIGRRIFEEEQRGSGPYLLDSYKPDLVYFDDTGLPLGQAGLDIDLEDGPRVYLG